MFPSVRLVRDSTRIAQPFLTIPQKGAMKLVREKNIVLLIISFDILNIDFISANILSTVDTQYIHHRHPLFHLHMTLDAEPLFLNLTSDEMEIFGNLTELPNDELAFFYKDSVNSSDQCAIVVTRTFYVQDVYFTNGTVNETDLDNEYTVGCPQIVTVIDTTPPNITCPSKAIIE